MLDFGIAEDGAGESDKLTRTGEVLCTPVYVAPERIHGRPATAGSDLYSLAVLMVELLEGQPPIRGSIMEIAIAHARPEAPVPLSPKTQAGPLGRVLARALDRDPETRFRTATEFREAIEHAMAGGRGTAAALLPAREGAAADDDDEAATHAAGGRRLAVTLAALGVAGLAGAALLAAVLHGTGPEGASPADAAATDGGATETASVAMGVSEQLDAEGSEATAAGDLLADSTGPRQRDADRRGGDEEPPDAPNELADEPESDTSPTEPSDADPPEVAWLGPPDAPGTVPDVGDDEATEEPPELPLPEPEQDAAIPPEEPPVDAAGPGDEGPPSGDDGEPSPDELPPQGTDGDPVPDEIPLTPAEQEALM